MSTSPALSKSSKSPSQTASAPIAPATPQSSTPELPEPKPPTTLLMGPPGAGKTTALATYATGSHPRKMAVLFTDPGGEESFIDALERFGIPGNELDERGIHWAYLSPMSATWDQLKEMGTKVSMMGYNDLTGIKSSGKHKDTQFMKMLSILSDFKCERSGKSLGPVDQLGPEWVFALDSISGLNTITMDMMQGYKPVAHQGEYGVAMNMEEKLIQKLISDTKCFIAMTAHVEKVTDSVTGRRSVNVSLIGQKLASSGKITRLFSDVILAVKEGDTFRWSTAAVDTDLKARALPISDKLAPDFSAIVDKYFDRIEKTRGSATKEAPAKSA